MFMVVPIRNLYMVSTRQHHRNRSHGTAFMVINPNGIGHLVYSAVCLFGNSNIGPPITAIYNYAALQIRRILLLLFVDALEMTQQNQSRSQSRALETKPPHSDNCIFYVFTRWGSELDDNVLMMYKKISIKYNSYIERKSVVFNYFLCLIIDLV